MVELTDTTIDTEALLRQVEDQSTGAVVLFLGRVRDHAAGKQVMRIDYEAYTEMSTAKMREIEAEIMQRWPVRQIAIVHRTGTLELGEVSVAVAVASAHRDVAFEACRYAIDTLKQTVPIWKKEYSPAGESWVEGIIPKVKQA